jgi:CheY-like chemotaxis protein
MPIPILVCDDLPEARTNLTGMLRHYEAAHQLALEIETAGDGAELLDRWRPGRWALIFLDIFMPKLDGVEAARKLRQAGEKCSIVFATTSRKHGLEGFELRVTDYLTKPFTQEDVDSAMDWFLQQLPK